MRPYISDLECPACGGRIREPLSRFSGPVTYLHHRGRGRRACRLLITPDATGEDHQAEEVPAGVSLEAALEEALGPVRRSA